MVKTITILILMLFALNLSSQTTSLSGDGSETNPYLIGSVADLEFMRDKVNAYNANYGDKHYKLTANLTFADDADSWIPIGTGYDNSFKGTFDGGCFTIDSIKIGSKDGSVEMAYSGLFGRTEYAIISNLSVAWKGLYASSSSPTYSGGIVGFLHYCSIINCSSSGSISSSSFFSFSSSSGGIVGRSFGGSISNCYSSGSVSSSSSSSLDSYSGGIVGYFEDGSINNCSSSGSISSSSPPSSFSFSSSGGIVGYLLDSSIGNCIALNSSVKAVGTSNNTSACRIVGAVGNNTTLSNNYAKAGIVVQIGASTSDLSDVVINDADKGYDKNHGADLGDLQPVDLLNAWVYEANKTAETPYLTWTVEEGVNNGYPFFGDPTDPTQCGDDAFWSYDATTKTLTIAGTGPMWDLDTKAQPWKSFAYQVVNVVIEEGITYIGASSFNGMKALVSATFGVTPNTFKELTRTAAAGSLVEIGHSAFFSCVSLKEVSIPEGVHTVGPMAFFGCSSLPEITIPSTLQYWRAWIFKNCTGLKKVTFSEGVTATGTYTFVGCTSLEEVVLPSTMERIEGFSFQGCKSLREITIPSEVTHIGLQAFENCSGLTKITTLATTPANVLEAAFNGVDKTIPVMVPVGTVDDHKAADGWKEFTNIQDGSTGIGGVMGEGAITVDGNNIVLSEAQQVAVYSAMGALIYQGYTDSITIDEAGLYIVKTASATAKVVIK